MNQNKLICLENTNVLLQTMTSLGFFINWEKSVLQPSQRIVFFGFIIDSVACKVYLTDEKIQKIITKARALLSLKDIPVRQLASFIGIIINAFFAVFEAKLHYRALERDKFLGLEDTLDFDKTMQLSIDSIIELKWWVSNVTNKNGKSIRPNEVVICCQTDASLEGYGCIDLKTNVYSGGRWTFIESKNSTRVPRSEMTALKPDF